MSNVHLRRPVTPREAELVEKIVRVSTPDSEVFVEQLHVAQGIGECPFVQFQVPPSAIPSRSVIKGVLEAENVRGDRESYTDVLLWIDDGRISALELVWASEDPPSDFPPADEVEVLQDQNVLPQARAERAAKLWMLPWTSLLGVTVGILLGLLVTLWFECFEGRCYPMALQWIPGLGDFSLPEKEVDDDSWGLVGGIGATLGGWLGARAVSFVRRLRGPDS